MIIAVSGWDSFQSYKDRKPPWIRFHKTLLDNFEYQSMSVDARALLPMLWLLASEDSDPKSGLIRYGAEKIAFRLRLGVENVTKSLHEIEASGFIQLNQSCNETVTTSLRNGRENVTPETETETETDIRTRYGSHVKLKEKDFEGLQEKMGDLVYSYIDRVNDYCAASKPKGYKDYAAAIRNFWRKDGSPVEQKRNLL